VCVAPKPPIRLHLSRFQTTQKQGRATFLGLHSFARSNDSQKRNRPPLSVSFCQYTTYLSRTNTTTITTITNTMKQPASYIFLLSALFLEQSSAFQSPRVVRRESSAPLHLLPGQGNQLVAAFTAACQETTDENHSVQITINKDKKHQPKEECHRSILSRIFSLPSNLIKKHPHPAAEGLEGDVVLYPMLGRTFFMTSDGECMSFPTKSAAACSIVKNKDEQVYGFFSPSCQLDPFSEDICHGPEN
jgi:hypothetical protein